MIKKRLGLLTLSLLFLGESMANSRPFFLNSLSGKNEVDCDSYEREGDFFILNPNCILNNQLPNLEFQDKVDSVSSAIQNIEGGYNPNKEFAVYKENSIQLDNYPLYPLNKEKRRGLISKHENNEKINIPIGFFASYYIKDLSIFSAEKDTSKLLPCTKINYSLAFNNLDGIRINAGESFNFNNYLFNLKGYCEGVSDIDLRFYGGVCGVASQLFRAALTTPILKIPVRWNHNERFSVYYGNTVQGDDASVYENSKKLILENFSDSDIIIKTFQKGDLTYILFFTEKESTENKRVEIKKDYESPLQVTLYRAIYKKEKVIKEGGKLSPFKFSFWQKKGDFNVSIIDSQIFTSHYFSINNENR